MAIVHAQCLICKSELRVDSWFETQRNSQASLLRLVSSYTSRLEPVFKMFMLCFTCGAELRLKLAEAIKSGSEKDVSKTVWAWLTEVIEETATIHDGFEVLEERGDCDDCNGIGFVSSGATDASDPNCGKALPCPTCQPKRLKGGNPNALRSNDSAQTSQEWSHLSRPDDEIDMAGVH